MEIVGFYKIGNSGWVVIFVYFIGNMLIIFVSFLKIVSEMGINIWL